MHNHTRARLPHDVVGAVGARCSGRGTYDAHRGICECPLGYEGATANFAAPGLRDRRWPRNSIAWVLHEFHNRGAASAGGRAAGGRHRSGAVRCLRQLVAALFLLERSRMVRSPGQRFEVCCAAAAGHLADLLARPSVGENLWRRFSFGAAYEALRAGVEPALDARRSTTRGRRASRGCARADADGRLECGGAGALGFDPRCPLPPLLGALAAALPNCCR